MRKLAVLASLIGSAASAADLEATSRIDSVVVHPDAAVATRIVEMDLPAGTTNVLIRGLSPNLDKSSLRVEGSGDAPFTILGFDLRPSPGESRPSIDRALEDRIKLMKQDRDALSGRIDALERKKATIEVYARASPEKLSPEAKPLDVSQWAAVWDAIGEGMARTNEDLRIQRERAKDLDGEIAALEAARPRPSQPSGAPKNDVAVALQAERPLRGTLRLAYRVVGASWAPVYDARLFTGDAANKPRLTLVRRAAITQRTGENWTDVALSLSTVATNRGAAAPELPALLAGFRPPPAMARAEPDAEESGRPLPLSRAAPAPSRPGAVGGGQAGVDQDGEAAPLPPPRPISAPAREQGAGLEGTAFTTSFTIRDRVSAPADGSTKTFLIGSRDFEPSLTLEAVPALNPSAFLEASFILEDEAPIFPGEAVLQRDGALIGRSPLALTAPGDRMRLGFGVDERLKIVRAPVKRKESETGFLGGSSKNDAREFRTKLKNLHDRPVRVRLVDRLPYAEATTIQIDMSPETTPPTERNVAERRGVMTWLVDLPPGAEKEIRFGYSIKWPNDKDVVYMPQPIPPR